MSWRFGVLVDPNTDLSRELKRVMGWDRAYQRQTEVVPIGCALRPSFDLFVGLQVMPCLSACFVQEPPSLNVSGFWFTNRGYRRAVEVLLRSIGATVQDGLLLHRHVYRSNGLLGAMVHMSASNDVEYPSLWHPTGRILGEHIYDVSAIRL